MYNSFTLFNPAVSPQPISLATSSLSASSLKKHKKDRKRLRSLHRALNLLKEREWAHSSFFWVSMESPLNALVRTFGRLPGVGPRLAQRTVLALLKDQNALLNQLMAHLQSVREVIRPCALCGNLDACQATETAPGASTYLCAICANPRRETTQLCVVETVSDLWALERARFFTGRYHVLGGVLSAMDNVGPGQLNLQKLVQRVHQEHVQEVILALSATLEGQATQFYIIDLLEPLNVAVSSFAQGVPMGGELNYLDDATLSAAFLDRRRQGRRPAFERTESPDQSAPIARRA